jgi:gluconate kinase
MVIFFVGLPGSGKSSLAKRFAQEIGATLYVGDTLKHSIYPVIDPEFQHKLDNAIPMSDEVKSKFYGYLIDEIIPFSEKIDVLVVDEVLNRREHRKNVFAACKSAFGECKVVWVNTPSEVVYERLSKGERKDHLLKDPWPMHQAIANIFEPVHEADIIVTNNKTIEEEVQTLREKLFRV